MLGGVGDWGKGCTPHPYGGARERVVGRATLLRQSKKRGHLSDSVTNNVRRKRGGGQFSDSVLWTTPKQREEGNANGWRGREGSTVGVRLEEVFYETWPILCQCEPDQIKKNPCMRLLGLNWPSRKNAPEPLINHLQYFLSWYCVRQDGAQVNGSIFSKSAWVLIHIFRRMQMWSKIHVIPHIWWWCAVWLGVFWRSTNFIPPMGIYSTQFPSAFSSMAPKLIQDNFFSNS